MPTGAAIEPRRAVRALLAGVLFLAPFGYFAAASRSVDAVSAHRTADYLVVPGFPRPALPETVRPLAAADLRRALLAAPLSQRVANAAMVRNQQAGAKAALARDLGIVRRLGWRDTVALQNLIVSAAAASDLDYLLQGVDALLRRSQLFTEAATMMSTVERFPEGRGRVAALLARRPPWRHDYLLGAGTIADPALVEGRFTILRALQRRGDRLQRDEVAPFLPVLVAAGRAGDAFTLWEAQRGRLVRPLADPDFVAAANALGREQIPVPFEWQLGSGDGYYVDLYRDGPGARLAISWNGRGVPVFASQQTSGTVARYRLGVLADASAKGPDALLAFRLACPGRAPIAFDRVVARRPAREGQVRTDFVTTAAVPCRFPALQIAGKPQSLATRQSVILAGLALAPA